MGGGGFIPRTEALPRFPASEGDELLLKSRNVEWELQYHSQVKTKKGMASKEERKKLSQSKGSFTWDMRNLGSFNTHLSFRP